MEVKLVPKVSELIALKFEILKAFNLKNYTFNEFIYLYYTFLFEERL